MQMRKWCLLGLLGGVCHLYGEVVLFPNPAQRYNNEQNYANRVIYLFIQVNGDGSVTLQVQPPPFYPQDDEIVNSGLAIIDCEKVVQNYTAAEVSAATTGIITATVTAKPNTSSLNGYAMYANLFQWLVNLDPKSDTFYQIQSTNISLPYSLNALYNVSFNSNNGEFSIFSKIKGYTNWLSSSQGAFLSESLIDNAYFTTTDPKNPSSQDFTFEVDFTKLGGVTKGTYSFYLVIQMEPIFTSQTFLDTLSYYLNIQQVQIYYLYNSVLEVNAYLEGPNALYDPVPADQVILNTNRTFLIDQYNKTLDAMSVQWNAYAALPNLTSEQKTVITQMLTFITLSEANKSNFNLE